jgi:glutamate/tyrosine decarboxylase-like PLP-dependent enzyme
MLARRVHLLARNLAETAGELSGMTSESKSAANVVDAVCAAAERIERAVAAGPIVPSVSAAEIRDHLQSHYDFRTPYPLHEVTADVERMLREWQVQVTHPRYFGLFNPSVIPASVVADTLTASYNPQLASWRTSPAANEIERHTLAWLTRAFGLPPETAASFTTGGAEANLSAVIVALTRAYPQYGERGLRGIDAAPVIYLTSESHHSFNKIAHVTGLGRAALRLVAVGPDLRMDVADLARRVAEDRRAGLTPLMVVGTAGTTGAGAIDPLAELAGFCQADNLWFHVDAAWGGAAVVSPRLRVHLAGIEAADSITCDAHKWFSVPMGAGMFFCRHPQSVDEAFRAETSYMPAKSGAATRDPYTSSIQWSRRFIGLKLFLALAERGERGYAAMIEHQAAIGDLLRDRLARAGWRIVNDTPLPLVCFTRDGLDPASYLAALYTRQIAWMSEVRLRGESALRACVTSYRTSEADVDRVVREMGTVQ